MKTFRSIGAAVKFAKKLNVSICYRSKTNKRSLVIGRLDINRCNATHICYRDGSYLPRDNFERIMVATLKPAQA